MRGITFDDISTNGRKATTKAFLEPHMRTVLDPTAVVVQGSDVTAGQDETAVAVEDDTAVAVDGVTNCQQLVNQFIPHRVQF